MKVYLLENIKGKGNKGEIKEFKDGYALFLIKDKKAIEYNDKTKTLIDVAIMEEEKHNILAKMDAQLQKAKLESYFWIFSRNLTPKGTINKPLTKKDLADWIERRTGIKIDTKKLKMPEILELNKEYIAELNLGYGVKAYLRILLDSGPSESIR